MWGVIIAKMCEVSMSGGRHTDIVHVLVGDGWHQILFMYWLVTAGSQL